MSCFSVPLTIKRSLTICTITAFNVAWANSFNIWHLPCFPDFFPQEYADTVLVSLFRSCSSNSPSESLLQACTSKCISTSCHNIISFPFLGSVIIYFSASPGRRSSNDLCASRARAGSHSGRFCYRCVLCFCKVENSLTRPSNSCGLSLFLCLSEAHSTRERQSCTCCWMHAGRHGWSLRACLCHMQTFDFCWHHRRLARICWRDPSFIKWRRNSWARPFSYQNIWALCTETAWWCLPLFGSDSSQYSGNTRHSFWRYTDNSGKRTRNLASSVL